jgi:hypothetical protein
MKCKHGMEPAWCSACKSINSPSPAARRISPATHIVAFKMLTDLCLSDARVTVHLSSSLRSTKAELKRLGLEDVPVKQKATPGSTWDVLVPNDMVPSLQAACPELRVHGCIMKLENFSRISSKELALDILLRRRGL